jgi:hypothetical protein
MAEHMRMVWLEREALKGPGDEKFHSTDRFVQEETK